MRFARSRSESASTTFGTSFGTGSASRRVRLSAAVAAAALIVSGAPLWTSPALAVEVPNGDFTGTYSIQTNGPNGAIGLGDYYSASTVQGGAGQPHLLKLNVPCSWPANKPIYLDLYSPYVNTATTGYVGSQTYEEPNGAGDTTTYTLNNPAGGLIKTTSYPPVNQTADDWQRFATIPAPATCGSYTLTDTTSNDDQNGWRLRFGYDDDANPNNTPPLNYDNPDGKIGTDDELTVGLQQISYQHDLGDGTPATAKCLTLFQYVAPGKPSITFNNFDMDNASLAGSGVRYYAPSAAYDPLGQSGGIVGTISGSTVWNKVGGGGTLTRSGDTIANPESGWWKIVTCINNHNQFIQEGQAGQPAYFAQPPTPVLQVAKTDSQTVLDPGQTVTYTVTVTNAAVGSGAGAATKVVSKDTLPAGLTPVSCAVVGATAGETCAFAGLVATATFAGALPALTNNTRSYTVTAQVVANNPPASFLNSTTTSYSDSIGNAFVPVVATDTDTLAAADLSLTKTHSGSFTVGAAAGSYALTVKNNSSSGRARGVKVVDTLPAGLTYSSFTPAAGWTCSAVGQTVTCLYSPDLAFGASAAVTINVLATTAAYPAIPATQSVGVTNNAVVSSNTPDPVAGNNSAADPTMVTAGRIGDKVFNDVDGSGTQNAGDTGAAGVTVNLLKSGTAGVFKTTTSAADGSYVFNGLDAATYTVQFVLPASTPTKVFTTVNTGGDPTLDSDANRTSGNSPPIVLAAGASDLTVDAGLVPQSTLGDFVFNDLDGSKTFTAGEPAISGATVNLYQAGVIVQTTLTDANGLYSFTGLTSGSYAVDVIAPTNFTGTGPQPAAPATTTFLLGVGVTDNTHDFGFQQTNGSIGDTVYNDLNGDGIQSGAGETGVGGVHVVLTRTSAGPALTLATDTSAVAAILGQYSFTGLPAGTYTVTFSTLPANVTATTPNPITGLVLGAGGTITNADLGIRQTNASIGDNVSVQGGGAAPATTITLYAADGTTQIGLPITTPASGLYTFSGLPAGSYVVKETVPSGYLAVGVTQYTSTVTAGQLLTTDDFVLKRANATIGNFVYNDVNNDGLRNDGATGLPNRTVTLAGPVTATAITAADGSYSFTGLPVGSYTVSVATPASFAPTGPAQSPTTIVVTDPNGAYVADFGFVQANASIGDTVFTDLDLNGVKDPGEVGVDGVTVTLYKADGVTQVGAPVVTATVGGLAGQYTFANLPAGTYQVKATPPANQAVTNSPYPLVVTLAAAQNVSTADIGLIQSNGQIGSFVYNDADGSNTKNGTEANLTNVTVTLKRGGTVVATQITADGSYLFTGLPVGTYTVEVSSGVPAGFTPTSTVPRTVTLINAAPTDLNENLGYRLTTGVIGDRVFNDLNGNNAFDPGEGLGSRTVTLKQGGVTVATAVTDATGLYQFTGLAAGDYTVDVPTPGGFTASGPAKAGAPSAAVTLTTSTPGGMSNLGIDFGFVQTNARIGDFVFLDANSDGVLDPTETTGVAGAVVSLFAADGTTTIPGNTPQTTTASGAYSFTGLAAGTYVVKVTPPASYLVTSTTPRTVGLTAGQLLDTVDFGVQKPSSVSGFVFDDQPGAGLGTKGTGENAPTGYGVVTVTLKKSGVVVATTTADPTTGAYTFPNLPAGSFTVETAIPTGRVATTPDPSTAFTLTNGQDLTPVNLGIERVDAAITGVTYVESDQNGTLQAGEPGLAGVQVTLKQNGVTVGSPTTSGAGGAYAFTGLAAGSYSVSYAIPSASYRATTNPNPAPNAGSTGSLASIVTTAGSTTPNNNLGLTLVNGSIGDFVYNDVNGNGAFDGADSGISGVVVHLLNAGNTQIAQTTTNGSGAYSFTGLSAGAYHVAADQPTGYGPVSGSTLPNPHDVTLALTGSTVSSDLTADFSFTSTTASIGDTVFSDLNGDGIQQLGAGEGGLAATVSLYTAGPDGSFGTADDVLVSSVVSSAAGGYSFAVAPGTYGVVVTPIGGTYASSPVLVQRTVAAFEVVSNADFGLAPVASVGDLVFKDNDGSGTNNAGDGAIAGAVVTVTQGSAPGGAVVGTATSGAGGLYTVGNLPAGTYTVSVALPAGQGLVATTVTSYIVTLKPGDAPTDKDFGARVASSTINGTVRTDVDLSGTANAGDTPLQGATVNLVLGGVTVDSRTTGPAGTYSFTGLPQGQYSVDIVPPAGFTNLTTPTPQPAATSGLDTVTRDFLEKQTNASIGQTVYVDNNADGTQTPGDVIEPGFNGAVLSLYAGPTATGPAVQQTTAVLAGVNGRYLFSGLSAGTYTVLLTLPNGYTNTTPLTQTNIIAAGQNIRVVNFGIHTLGVAGTVYVDPENNGFTAGEVGKSGVVVTLHGPAGVPDASTTTDAQGNYVFNGVAPGQYTVTIATPAGFVLHDPTTAVPFTVSTGAGVTGKNFEVAPTTGSIGDLVFTDLNKDGVPGGAGETGLQNGTITVTQGGVTVGTATSGANGGYVVTGLPTGDYTVAFTPPAGFTATTTTPKLNVHVNAGALTGTADFGAVQTNATIGNEIYLDANGNGVKDPSETTRYLPVLSLTLTGPQGITSTIGTTTTSSDGTGLYSFTGLAQGNYTVQLTPGFSIPGYRLTTAPLPIPVTLGAGQTFQNADFGLEPIPGEIKGNVFSDLLNDGLKNGADGNLQNVTVTLTKGGVTIATLVTDASGNYDVTGLPLGDYVVTVTKLTGTVVSTTNPVTLTVTDGTPKVASFGLAPSTFQIGDLVFADANGDGLVNGTDAGLGSVTVTLTKADGTFVGTTTTAANGSYAFTGLPAGGYVVTLTVPNGSTLTTAAGNPIAVTLTSASVSTADFGVQQINAGLTGLVYNDANGDKTQGSGELGLGGQTVTLSGGPTTRPPTTTLGDGSYAFSNLAPGDYVVTFTPKAGSTTTTTNPLNVSVPANTVVPNVTFGVRVTSGSISGPVFSDTNGNGVDDGVVDPPLATTVVLSQNGTMIATVTSTGGTYSFPNLPAGDYTVTATAPAGTNQTTTATTTVTVTSAAVPGPAFGFQPVNASLSGTVYNDPAAGGAPSAGTPYPGATVTLYQGVTPLNTQVTDAGGAYTFPNLPAGEYTVRVTLPTGFVANSPVSVVTTLAPSGAVTGVDFGILQQDAALSGSVYDDRNFDLTQNLGEPDRAGVVVTLYKADGTTQVATTTTDATGRYLFSGLVAGGYVLRVTPPTGTTVTTAASRAQSLTAGQSVQGLDFGLGVSALGDTVYDDTNGNGTQDAGELGLNGVTVTLTHTGDLPISIQTDANGKYAFDSLLGGSSYTVTVGTPTGRTATTPATVTVLLPVATVNNGVDFGSRTTPNAPPVFTSNTPDNNTAQTVAAGGSLAPLTATDANGDTLTYGLNGGSLPAGVSLKPDGTFTGSPTGPAGTYTATIDVVDGKGGSDTTTLVVTVPNTAPVTAANTQSIPIGTAPAALTATDANGDTLTFVVSSGTLPAGLTLNSDGTFSGTASAAGTKTVTVTVTDGHGGSTPMTVTITVQPNGAPVSNTDTVTTPGGAPITFDPRTNDTDPSGTPLTISGVTTPAHGTVTCTTTSCTYTPTVGYTGPDTFTYTVTAAGSGLSTTGTVNVTVTNTAPTYTTATTNDAQTVPTGTGLVPLAATDANGDVLTFALTTGTLPTGITLNPNGTFAGTATAPGTFTATITVTDAKGATDVTTLVVTVNGNLPPAFTGASGNTSQTIPVGGTPTAVTATDPNPGQTVTYTATGGTLPAGITLNTDGTFAGTATTPGPTTVTITATDNQGASTTTSLTITVTAAPDRAPVAVNDTVTVASGASFATAVLANDTDPDNDPLTVASVTQPAHGTVSCDNVIVAVTHPAPTCTYTSTAGYSGPDSYTYVVSDGRGLTATGTVNVTVTAPVNHPPVFDPTSNNTSQTLQTGQTPLPVTASDQDGDPLRFTVTSGTLPAGITLNPNGTFSGSATTPTGPVTVTVSVTDGRGGTATTPLQVTIMVLAPPVGAKPVANADIVVTPTNTPKTTSVLANDTDADGNPLSVVGHSDPLHGTVVCTATACTYTPDNGYAGPDSYTYTVSDGTGNTAVGTVSVTVQNAPPAFTGVTGNSAQTVPVGTKPVPLSATDANGDRLTYTVPIPAPGTPATSRLPAGLVLNPDGTFSGAATTPGTYTVIVTVADGKGGTDTTTLVITVVAPVNQPPVAVDDTRTVAGAPVVIAVLGNDTDPNAGDTLTIAGNTQPAHGTATCTATVCTYTATAGYTGSDTFDYTVSDGKGGTDVGTVILTVTAAKLPPVASPDSATTLEDTPIKVSVLGNDTDPNKGDTLMVTAVTQPAHGTVSCTAAGVCTYTPAKNYNGPDSFTYTVSDGHGGTATTTVTLTVTPVNDPPVAKPDKTATTMGTPVTLHVTSNDSDPEGDPLTVTVATQPTHGTATCAANGNCTYTPAAGFSGTDSYTYTLSDGHGGTSTTTVTVVVRNGAPTANPDTVAVFSGTPAVIPVLGNDTDPSGDALTVVSHGNPSHGTVTCTAGGCTYTATSGFTGTDTFTYTVSDGHGNTSTSTVTTTVTNPTDGGNGGGGTGTGGNGGGGTGSGGGKGGLPFTGADTQSQTGWALGMLGFGLVLLLVGRKRRGRP